jgi:hypothetical protein
MPPDDLWAAFRYGPLLAAAARHRRLGRAYAELAGAVEFWRDRPRRRVAAMRAARWLGASTRDAARIFHRCLVSEALEEADNAYFMRHEAALDRVFRSPSGAPSTEPGTIWATLHMGSPILAYLYLRRVRRLPVAIVGRALDDTNPMPAAKRSFGKRKVAWLEAASGRPLLGVDARAIARARRELIEGRDLFAAIDVPGDVSARSAVVTIGGERVRLAAGMIALAGLTAAPIQPVVGVHEAGAIVLHYGRAIEAREAGALVAVGAAVADLVRRFPEEWWLWPYVAPG